MGASVRPDTFDRAGAKAAGYTDAEIDEYLMQSVGPRRSLVSAPAASPAPAQPPAPRPGILTRTADAVKGLGRAVVSDPIGTAKGIGSGIVQTGADLASLGTDPTALQRMFVQEGADPRKTAVRAANAGSLLLPAAGRAMGMGIKGIAAADMAAGAGLGAANTPDDPGVGALLGAGMTGVSYAGNASRAVRNMGDVFDLDGVTKGMDDALRPQNVPSMAGRPRTGLPVEASPVRYTEAFDEIDALMKKGKGIEPTPDLGGPRRRAVTETVRSGTSDDVLAQRIAAERAQRSRSTTAHAGPERVVPEAPIDEVMRDIVPPEAAAMRLRSVDNVVVPPNPTPALGTARQFPEGYSTASLYDDFVREAQPGIADDVARAFDAPNPTPAPRATEAFPDGFQTPDVAPGTKAQRGVPPRVPDTPAPLTPRASAVPTDAPPVTPRVTPEAAPVTPPTTDPMRALDEGTPRNVLVPDNIPAPEPVANANTATITNTATRSADPVAVGSMPGAAEAAVPELPGGRPQLPPNERGAVNWQTWLDPESPGAKSVEARLQQLAPPEKVQASRGYESMNATYARSLAAAKELVDDNGLQTLDAKKVRAFVERHGEAAIPALKRVATENASVMDQAAKAMNNPLASADEVAAATRVYESAMRQTDELLGNIVQEQARTGRSLNALKIQAKLSSDPDTWLVHAKRALGDQPMSDEIMASVRRLAREAADACGGG